MCSVASYITFSLARFIFSLNYCQRNINIFFCVKIFAHCTLTTLGSLQRQFHKSLNAGTTGMGPKHISQTNAPRF